jgi:hypothetical protein
MKYGTIIHPETLTFSIDHIQIKATTNMELPNTTYPNLPSALYVRSIVEMYTHEIVIAG